MRTRHDVEKANGQVVSVFFYGLFMDESLLASKGIRPSESRIGHVEGYGIRIGTRATLVRDHGNRAYGVLMKVQAKDVNALYSDESVADYIAESVLVVLSDGSVDSAICYNLPEHKLKGTNSEYALSLLALANKLGLPDTYVQQIRKYAA